MEKLSLPGIDSISPMIALEIALTHFYNIPEIKATISEAHVKETPQRIVKSMLEMFRGCGQNPEEIINKGFEERQYDEMIYENGIPFVSNCAHHNLPFFGKACFAYIPEGKIVGLSKIPRLIEAYSYRPQVQEKLTEEIVDTFMNVIKPRGCGLVMEAYHLCMMIRGVKSAAVTKTTALRGIFKDSASTKQEFLSGIKKTTERIWP